MDVLQEADLFMVVLDDLLDAPWRKRRVASGRKGIVILGIGTPMTL